MGERLKGKKALITGAGKKTGIGFGIARKLAGEGADVIVADLVKPMTEFEGYVRTSDAELLDEAVAALRESGVRAEGVPVDVTDLDSIEAMAEAVGEKFGGLDILVNNAGGSPGVSTLMKMEERAWLYNFDLNLHSVLRVTRAVDDILNENGSVINISSRAGKFPSAFMGAYCTAKAGVIMMSKVMALEFSSRKIRVNAVCPGQVDTEMGQWSWRLKAAVEGLGYEEYREVLANRIPLKRLGVPEDIANVVLFLAGDESAFMTGQAINVTGGQLMEL